MFDFEITEQIISFLSDLISLSSIVAASMSRCWWWLARCCLWQLLINGWSSFSSPPRSIAVPAVWPISGPVSGQKLLIRMASVSIASLKETHQASWGNVGGKGGIRSDLNPPHCALQLGQHHWPWKVQIWVSAVAAQVKLPNNIRFWEKAGNTICQLCRKLRKVSTQEWQWYHRREGHFWSLHLHPTIIQHNLYKWSTFRIQDQLLFSNFYKKFSSWKTRPSNLQSKELIWKRGGKRTKSGEQIESLQNLWWGRGWTPLRNFLPLLGTIGSGSSRKRGRRRKWRRSPVSSVQRQILFNILKVSNNWKSKNLL